MIYIYVLVDPRTDLCYYVGKTSDLKRRLRKHLNDKLDTHKRRWINKLLAAGLKPYIHAVQLLEDSEDWQKAERLWIKFLRQQPSGLCNGTDGGDGFSSGCVFSDVHRERLRVAAINREYSTEYRLKLSLARKGRKRSAEASRKAGLALKGRKRPKYVVEKIREVLKNSKLAKAHLDKLHLQRKGTKVSEEMKKRISVTLKEKHRLGYSLSAEARLAISLKMREIRSRKAQGVKSQ